MPDPRFRREEISANGETRIIGRLLKKSFFAGCSKMPRCKATEILRNEAYLDVRRNDEG